jgi:hypothetical protein
LIFVNLKPRQEKPLEPLRASKKKHVDWWLPVAGAVFVLAFSVWYAANSYTSPSSYFGVEERETLVFQLNVLELDSPELSKPIAIWRDRITQNQIEVVVEQLPLSSALIREEGGVLRVSNRFFSADFVSQKQAVSALVGAPVSANSSLAHKPRK